jgi:hypothetical protein
MTNLIEWVKGFDQGKVHLVQSIDDGSEKV